MKAHSEHKQYLNGFSGEWHAVCTKHFPFFEFSVKVLKSNSRTDNHHNAHFKQSTRVTRVTIIVIVEHAPFEISHSPTFKHNENQWGS